MMLIDPVVLLIILLADAIVAAVAWKQDWEYVLIGCKVVCDLVLLINLAQAYILYF